ncbi:TIGR04211 family SH3 domain-containing protein [Pseudaeromonas sp. ZJS20]|uniref:TIGR04211 family SH3 domain-containing protein n=1 Tax=Pseudaeromonas aegiceratis TaxID=3153928 RepID=UPI00390C9775
MKRLLPLLLLCLPLGLHAAETRYVSEKLHTFLLAGPGKQFRILGSLNAGDPVTLLGLDESGKFAQLTDDRGRTGWLPVGQLQQTESLASRQPKLEQQLSELQAKLASKDSDTAKALDETQQQLSQVQGQLASQAASFKHKQEQLVKLVAENERLAKQLGTQEHDEQMRWLRNGGLVAGLGALAGIVLVYLPRPRRKKSEGWIN